MEDNRTLGALRRNFRETSTQSMPIAGMLFWAAAAIASRILSPEKLAYFVGFGSGIVFPLGLAIDHIRGKPKPQSKSENPLIGGFLQNLAIVALLWPFVILAALGRPSLVVLGGAILMGIVWIPYGWAADDPVGLRHALARTIFCYAAYIFLPPSMRLTIICLIVIGCYAFSMLTMRPVSVKTG